MIAIEWDVLMPKPRCSKCGHEMIPCGSQHGMTQFKCKRDHMPKDRLTFPKRQKFDEGDWS